MFKKKRFGGLIAGVVALFAIVLFLWPHSLLNNKDSDIESIAVVIVEESFDHDNDTYVYNIQDSKFRAIMEVLDSYSYHMSLKTISSYFSDGAHLEVNEAGYWLNIYLYTEPNRNGECYGIISGGTGDITVEDAVYRMGYWGNSTQLKFMSEICQVVNP